MRGLDLVERGLGNRVPALEGIDNTAAPQNAAEGNGNVPLVGVGDAMEPHRVVEAGDLDAAPCRRKAR